jgi:succinyl-diaminopimelate desuccinylase
MRPDLTRIVDTYQNDVVNFTRRLVQTKSLAGQEQDAAALVQAEMEKLGYDRVWRDEVGNVIGLVKGPADGRSVMLNNHMDHVDSGDESQWRHPPYAGVTANDFIWGRGACDGKGALAVQVYAPVMARKAPQPPRGDTYVTSVVLEERGGWGAEHLVKHLKTNYAIVGQPSRNELRAGHRGRMELIARFTGHSVHASVPARGANPHYAMARFLMRLRELRMVSNEVFGYSTVAPTTIASDQSSTNVIPGELRLTLDWRNIPSEQPAQVTAKLQRLMNDCAEAGVRATVEVATTTLQTYTGLSESKQIIHPGYYLPETDAFVITARTILANALQREVELGTWSFATDGGHLMAAGIPTIGFAPGEESFAHTVQERVAIAQLREAAVGYVALLGNL